MKLIKTEDEQGVMYSLSGDNLPENYVLSKQNCDEEFAKAMGVVDVEKLAKDFYETRKFESSHIADPVSFKIGFNKAMELNKDKLFTIDDLYRVERCYLRDCDNDIKYKGQIVQRILNEKTQQPTEIDVEIEMEEAQEIYRDGTVKYIRVPKLDSSGNLILKKI
jgi:hypothetical protein